MMKFAATFLLVLVAAFLGSNGEDAPVDYSGHKVITVIPQTKDVLFLLEKLRADFGVDLWNEPKSVNVPVMMRLRPDLVDFVMKLLKENGIEHFVAFHDLQRAIVAEKVMNAPTNKSQDAVAFDFGTYHTYEKIVQYLNSLATTYPNIVKLDVIGQSYENRPIYVVKITSGESGTKPAIMMECGIHAREWVSVSTGLYILNELTSKYGPDPVITSLVNKYEFYIIPEANPDGYIYSMNIDRIWRKTRSRSNIDWLGNCRGADANRNFDIEHCGVGTSRRPCDEIYCGDAPFSESESRALRDLMIKIGNKMKAYFSIHAFSQLWMTPYGINKSHPPNYNELVRVSNEGVLALSKRYGTIYNVGSIANIIYEAAGSSVDYAYVKQNVKMAFALELRDKGRYGFLLPIDQIIPTAEETWDGLQAAILALA